MGRQILITNKPPETESQKEDQEKQLYYVWEVLYLKEGMKRESQIVELVGEELLGSVRALTYEWEYYLSAGKKMSP